MAKKPQYGKKPMKDLWKKAGFRSPGSFEKYRRDPMNYGKHPYPHKKKED